MKSEACDVLIIGGGNGAFGVTVLTRAVGMRVVMVEARDLGGTCPNRGCTPKKVLVAAAHACTKSARRMSIASASASRASIGRRSSTARKR
jgi:glutathione reductase (NADPH)